MNYEQPEMQLIEFLNNVKTNDFMIGSVNQEGDGESIDPWS